MPLAELEGRRVYYEEHGAGDPVPLINGLAADHTSWGLQTEFFRKHFRVIVFDNPGIGQTEGPRGPYTSALFATPLELAREIWLWVFTPRFFEERADTIAELEKEVEANPYPQSAEAFSDQAEACIGHEALASVEAPTLITVGDGDILTPPSHSFEFKARMPRALLHVWREMRHAPFWEIPDEFNELTCSFLSAH